MYSPGMRVVLRYTHNGSLTDALGEVRAVTATHVEVSTKSGLVQVPLDAIELGHEIPPAPTRPGKLHEIVSAQDVRKITAAVWSPQEIAWLNAENLAAELTEDTGAEVSAGWLLRAAPGAGPAANSVLPLSDPGVEISEALELALTWLSDRGSSPHVIIHTAAQSGELAPASAQLAPLLRQAGFEPGEARTAFTVSTAALAGGPEPPAGLEIVESDAPARAHFDVWGINPEVRDTYAALMASGTGPRLLSAVAHHPDGSTSLVGVVRVAFAMKWAVVSHLVVNPRVRRRGAGSALMTAAARISVRRGVRSMVVDVPAGQPSEFVTACGFSPHHRWWIARPVS